MRDRCRKNKFARSGVGSLNKRRLGASRRRSLRTVGLAARRQYAILACVLARPIGLAKREPTRKALIPA
jgi:hypothetical protein